jgi:hypothetical protein
MIYYSVKKPDGQVFYHATKNGAIGNSGKRGSLPIKIELFQLKEMSKRLDIPYWDILQLRDDAIIGPILATEVVCQKPIGHGMAIELYSLNTLNKIARMLKLKVFW